jgi:hypothetical protein
MKIFVYLSLLLLLITASDCHADCADFVKEARRKFYADRGERFARRLAVAWTAAPERYRYDMKNSSGGFIAAFQVAHDHRLCFARINISSGKFANGKLYVFGMKERDLSAKEFDRLRSEKPMAVVRAGGDKAMICLYPKSPMTNRLPVPFDRHFVINPNGRLFGGLPAALAAFKVRYDKLCYDIVWHGPKGKEISLGKLTGEKTMARNETFKAMREGLSAWAKANPKKIPEGRNVVFGNGTKIVKRDDGTIEVPYFLMATDADIKKATTSTGRINWDKARTAHMLRVAEWQELYDEAVCRARGLDCATTEFYSDREIIDIYRSGEIEYRATMLD